MIIAARNQTSDVLKIKYCIVVYPKYTDLSRLNKPNTEFTLPNSIIQKHKLYLWKFSSFLLC